MSKNIILIDRSLDIIESLSRYENAKISVLIVASPELRETARNKYKSVGEIYTIEEAQSCSNISLSYQEIEEFRETQLKVTDSLLRQSSDYNLINYTYYNALAFWLNIFKRLKIDSVLVSEIELGTPYINIPIEIAKKSSIPAFLLDPILNNGSGLLAKGVNFYNKKEYVDLSLISDDIQKIDINNFLFNSSAVHKVKERMFSKDRLKVYAFNIWGMFFFSIVSMVTNKFDLKLNGFPIKWKELFLNSLLLKRLLKTYSKYTENPKEENYIFYALHFEPEASIMTRVPLNNQLTIIKMLHDSLPSGWKIYIKEHPHQFSLANHTRWYQLKNINFFRSIEFYGELRKLENVRFMPFEMLSRPLIEKAQGIASINGTVAIEAAKYKKPLFLFGHLSNPFGFGKDVFKIASQADIILGFERIVRGFKPQYDDFNTLVEKYLFQTPTSGRVEWGKKAWEYILNLDVSR